MGFAAGTWSHAISGGIPGVAEMATHAVQVYPTSGPTGTYGSSCTRYHPATEETWYVDVAYDTNRWMAALWTTDRGMRICPPPPWVTTQQGAELAAIEMAANFAAYERLTQLHFVADNMSAIWSTIWNKSNTPSPTRAHQLRRIAGALRWSGLRMRLSWIASRFNPADCPSPASKYDSFVHMAADTEATYRALQCFPEHTPKHMGWAHRRG